MDALVELPLDGHQGDVFTTATQRRLESLVTVDWNDGSEHLSEADLSRRLENTEICITGWGSPRLTESVLDHAEDLRLLAHVGGSVASVASEAVFDRGVHVCSANTVMAEAVAEGVLAYLLAALRSIPTFDREIRRGDWPSKPVDVRSLYGAEIGFVGLGEVGRTFLELLAPFEPSVSVYDPYVDSDALSSFAFANLTSLDDALADADIVSVHAAKTPETIGLLDEYHLDHLPDGCLLINTARGAIVDESALLDELSTGRITAALDVFETEPLPEDHPFRSLDSVVLGPHVAGSPSRHRLAPTIVDEIERYIAGKPLEHTISRERYVRMTRDTDRSK